MRTIITPQLQANLVNSNPELYSKGKQTLAGVRITTSQLAKCEYNAGLASKNAKPLTYYILGQLFLICLNYSPVWQVS
jgi:hypothetical protein